MQGLTDEQVANTIIAYEPIWAIDVYKRQVVNRLKEQKYEIEFEPDVKEMVAKEGIDKNFGARPLRRTIQNLVEEKLAEEILDGKLEKGKVNKITVRQLRVN